MTAFTLPFGKIGTRDHARVGGKCASLGEMTQAGIAVPTGFAVTTDAYLAMLDQTGLRAEIEAQLASTKFDDVSSLERSAQAIQIRFRSHKLPADVEAAIRNDYKAMGDDLPVAVRSSATAEDLPDASFAGQQDTYLWVVGADTVIEHVRDCWASLFTARAMKYRHDNDLGQIEVLMSVAVQKMVNAQTAGVAMTLDPLTGDRTRIVIDASYGLGELVVSGIVTPDNFTVEKILMEVIDRKISDKHVELVPDVAAKTTVEREVAADRRNTQCLTDAQVMAVAQLAKALERQNKCPQDVEWAFDADLPEGQNLVALQSRPETVWSQKPAEPAKTSFSTGMMGMVGALNNPVGSKK